MPAGITLAVPQIKLEASVCGDNPAPMLQRLRHHRTLGTTVLMAFALAWLAALLANMPTRMALAQLQPLAYAQVCSEHDAAPAGGSHDGAPAAHHADPSCLLCLALGTPPTLAALLLRAPLPRADLARTPLAAPALAWRALAPLPARGPPATIHA